MQQFRSLHGAVLLICLMALTAHPSGADQVDRPQKIIDLEVAANHGDSNAAFDLCKMYKNGDGVPQSDAEAHTWCQKSLDLGGGRGGLIPPPGPHH